MKTRSYNSIRQMLSQELLYPTAKVIKYGNKIYPSIRAAAHAEKVSPTYIKSHCKVYDRKAIRETIVSQIQF